MDVEEWDPRVDKYLSIKYDKTTVYAGKAAAKEALQADTGAWWRFCRMLARA